MTGSLAPLIALTLLAGCAIDRTGLGGAATGEDAGTTPRLAAGTRGPDGGGGVDAATDAGGAGPDAGSRDAGETSPDATAGADATAGSDAASPLGCVPAGWREAFRDDFGGGLSAWTLDANAGSSADWTTSGGHLVVDSPSVGSDSVVDRAADGDVAVAAVMSIVPTSGASGLRGAGLIVRASSIDFAENDFYFCGLDPSSGRVVLARYDPSTRMGSGQGFTSLDEVTLAGRPTFPLLVTLCARGDELTCEIPDVSVRLRAVDATFGTGWNGLRVMQSETDVDWLAVYVP